MRIEVNPPPTAAPESPAFEPTLRFPPFRDSESWHLKRLVDICTKISQGGTPDTSKPEFWGGAINWITPAEMGKTESPFIASSNRTITEQGLRECASDLLPVGTVVLSVRAPIGHLAINTIPIGINQGCKGLIAGPSLHSYFLYCSLLRARSQLIDLGAGNTFKELSGSALKGFVVPVPSLAEQQKIAECLRSVDELIAAQARKVDALKTHKRGLIRQLFPLKGETQPRVRFPEFRSAAAWEVKPLGEVAENLDNQRIPITSNERKTGHVPYYGASGVVDYVEGYIFDEDLLCVSEDGANLVARTYPIAFPISGKTWVNNHAHVLRFKHACTQKFVELYLNSIELDDFITGMAQPKLNKAMLETIPIPHPDVSEQRLIADCLRKLDELIRAEIHRFSTLKAHKNGLMQQLFPKTEDVEA